MSANRNLFINAGAVEAADGTATDPSLVADGKVAILDREALSDGSQDLTSENDGAKFTIVRGGDNPQIDHIDKDRIQAVRVQDYRAEVQQVSAIGFDGTTGSLSDAEGFGSVKVVNVTQGFEPFPRISGSVNVEDADFPYDVAADLVSQLNGARKDFVTADILSDVSTSALAETYTVVKGSKNIEGSASSTATVGNTIRIGGDGADDANPVYVVDAIDGSTVTLDRPYQGDSASGVSAGDGNAPAEGDAVGIQLTATPSEDGEAATSFQTATDGIFAGDNVTALTTPVTATGSAAQIRNLEEFAWGNLSYTMTNYFPQTPKSHVVDGETYDLAVIEYKNNNDDAVVSQNATRQIYIAFPSDTSGADNIKTFFGI